MCLFLFESITALIITSTGGVLAGERLVDALRQHRLCHHLRHRTCRRAQ